MLSGTPIYEPGRAWTDDALADAFRNNEPVRRAQLYGLIAWRSRSQPALLELLRGEALDPAGLKIRIFGFVRHAWLPVFAVLEHGDDAGRSQLKAWVRAWPQADLDDFLSYLEKDADCMRWFDRGAWG